MRSSPWIPWRRYVPASSGAIASGRDSGEGQHIPDFRGPALELEAVGLEEGEGDALEAEAHAGAVGHRAVVAANVEGDAEVVEVVVARADRRGLLGRADRHHELVLEVLLALHHLLHLAAAAEEGVVG